MSHKRCMCLNCDSRFDAMPDRCLECDEVESLIFVDSTFESLITRLDDLKYQVMAVVNQTTLDTPEDLIANIDSILSDVINISNKYEIIK